MTPLEDASVYAALGGFGVNFPGTAADHGVLPWQ